MGGGSGERGLHTLLVADVNEHVLCDPEPRVRGEDQVRVRCRHFAPPQRAANVVDDQPSHVCSERARELRSRLAQHVQVVIGVGSVCARNQSVGTRHCEWRGQRRRLKQPACECAICSWRVLEFDIWPLGAGIVDTNAKTPLEKRGSKR